MNYENIPPTVRFETFGMCELACVDPDRNRRRYYCISLQPGLFDMIVQRQWGRLGSQPRTKDEFYNSIEEGVRRANTLYREKIRRGYQEF